MIRKKKDSVARVNISNLYKKVKLPTKKIRALVKNILNGEKLDFTEVNLIFIDDEMIHRINREFLKHDYPTDVISFELSDELPVKSKVAEIYISIDRAIEQSKFYKVNLENEIARLVAHGLIHLAGYDDKTTGEKLRMRRKESYYIKMAGF
ncbi:MAG: rRNA maturation RNase YbeY [Candidatus Kryptonium sp.]|nr:rRNA maturation RNase YbeY [Candidatus Kryptonium sp.]MCX7762253.1 rRNA maturation RNase YbeY [Candidatus Kryptonium sp.]MDW8109330.1 rRNA maturation RNase YbeY [Candidatus Kryptonium sp.]